MKLFVMPDEQQILTLVRTDHPDDQGQLIDITDAELDDIRRVEKEFISWQRKLAERCGSQDDPIGGQIMAETAHKEQP